MSGRECEKGRYSVSLSPLSGCIMKLICQIQSQLYLTPISELFNIPQATFENPQMSTTQQYTVLHPVRSASLHLPDQGLHLELMCLDYQERSWLWTCSRRRNACKLPKLPKRLDSRRMKLLEDLRLPKHQYVNMASHLEHGS